MIVQQEPTTLEKHVFIPGQRWISDSESELGLGTVLSNCGRQVTIVFMYSGETRIYSSETAPLTRIRFYPGDRIESHEGWNMTVCEVKESEGLLIYHGMSENGNFLDLPETALSNFIRLNQPQERLLSGQLDDQKWFGLRSDTYRILQAQSHSRVYGLRGARVELIPHQIYIASEVGSRISPRVLLADEVGLGKTIEAGLILHYQLLREQIRRVLIIVPDALLHQWLVELLRRFNLQFQIMDTEKYSAIKREDTESNPFYSAQLVLCGIEFLCSTHSVQQDLIDASWDTLVVDEAHHLRWSGESVSREYALIERLSKICPSVLLLTATPEQLGIAGHFARLRLLDASRFSDLPKFIEETKHYRQIAEFADALLSHRALNSVEVEKLRQLTGEDFLTASEWQSLTHIAERSDHEYRNKLLARLVDQHGTGRLLFRNTRQAIGGFPERRLHQFKLADDKPEQQALIDWLGGFLRQRYPDKCLMICASADTVLELAEGLRVRFGVQAALFHEQMTIVERDRAAAWFADPDDDCPILISSEIGSEGRNFQFLHNLILYEIPENPDLLEQRIGRLDRIGQGAEIQIHVPFQAGSRDHRLLRWYHEGLNAFEKTCSTGSQILAEAAELLQAVLTCSHFDDSKLEKLVSEGRKRLCEKNAALEKGRDRLLELNSNRREISTPLIVELESGDADHSLCVYINRVFDCFGVEFEEQSNRCWIVQPGRHMRVAQFPGIPDSGMTITFDRKVALAREEVEFLTWDHPLVTAAMDLIISNPEGQTGFAIIHNSALDNTILLLESVYKVVNTNNSRLNLDYFLPPEILRFIVSENGDDLTHSLASEQIETILHPVDKSQAQAFIQSRSSDLRSMIESTEQKARDCLPDILRNTRSKIETEYTEAINRLKHLQQYNRLIRDDEIRALEQQHAELQNSLRSVFIQLIGLRVLVNIH